MPAPPYHEHSASGRVVRPGVGAVNPFARLPAHVRVLLFLTVALPFALAALLASGRHGAEQRRARADQLGGAAARIVRAEPAGNRPDRLLEAASGAGYPAVVYLRADSAGGAFRRVLANPAAFGEEGLGRRETRALLDGAAVVAGRPSAGAFTVLAALRDQDQRVTGALLVADSRTAPPLLPVLPVAAGLLALTALLFAAAAFGARPTMARRLLVYAPALAFFGWLLSVEPAAPGERARLWTAVLALAWLVAATVGTGRLIRHQRSRAH
jgi:hypothetical protein